ncbi:MAG: redox-sensing transcriptional repressor Rex [Candidatus Omnitrophota bacterium]
MNQFPQKTITRLLIYLRTVENLLARGRDYISSRELAEMIGLTDVQIRKDISRFGPVGKPRIGYNLADLKKVLEECVTRHTLHVALFGAGNLGAAILKYPGFHRNKVQLVAAFDRDPAKIGQTINGVQIYSIDDAPFMIPQVHAEIGVIAVPDRYSQQIADVITASHIKGIVNFSPTSVRVPPDVLVKDIDLTIEFLSLFCDMNNHKYSRQTLKQRRAFMAKILMVDDNADFLDAGKIVLESKGHTVILADNVADGESKAKSENPDLIFLDIMMEQPDDGIALAHKLRKNGITTPIVMLSAVSKVTGYDYEEDSDVLPADDFLPKPVSPQDLIKKVETILQK